MATDGRTSYGIIEIDYVRYVLPIEDAITVVSILAEAERYVSDYIESETTGERGYVHKIVPPSVDQKQPNVKVLSPATYKAYRMAGDKDAG